MLSVSVFAQRDSLLSVTTAYITPLNTGLQLADEEEEAQFVKGILIITNGNNRVSKFIFL